MVVSEITWKDLQKEYWRGRNKIVCEKRRRKLLEDYERKLVRIYRIKEKLDALKRKYTKEYEQAFIRAGC